MKNIGSQRISFQEINQSDVFCGVVGVKISRITYTPNSVPEVKGEWAPEIIPAGNSFWDPGETLAIYAKPTESFENGDLNSFQFILPNGVWRSTEFVIT
jgi:hypothetical protein